MNTFSVSNSLDPDQAQHFVRPDLGSQGPDCLQTLSADDTLVHVVKELHKQFCFTLKSY